MLITLPLFLWEKARSRSTFLLPLWEKADKSSYHHGFQTQHTPTGRAERKRWHFYYVIWTWITTIMSHQWNRIIAIKSTNMCLCKSYSVNAGMYIATVVNTSSVFLTRAQLSSSDSGWERSDSLRVLSNLKLGLLCTEWLSALRLSLLHTHTHTHTHTVWRF